MFNLTNKELIVLMLGQNAIEGSLCKTRRICSRCKRKRYIEYLKIAECNQCLICRNKSRCISYLPDKFDKL